MQPKYGCLLAAIVLPVLACVTLYYRFAPGEPDCKATLRLHYLNLMNYENTKKHLPPAFIADEDGKKTQSWRAELLKYWYSDYADRPLQFQYDFSQSWDSRHNKEVLVTHHLFECPAHSDAPEMTNYVAITGKGTLWPGAEGAKLTPSSRDKILLVELPQSDVPWTEPRDFTLDEFLNIITKTPKGIFYNGYVNGIRAIDASGDLHTIDPTDDVDKIRRMFVFEEDSEQ